MDLGEPLGVDADEEQTDLDISARTPPAPAGGEEGGSEEVGQVVAEVAAVAEDPEDSLSEDEQTTVGASALLQRLRGSSGERRRRRPRGAVRSRPPAPLEPEEEDGVTVAVRRPAPPSRAVPEAHSSDAPDDLDGATEPERQATPAGPEAVAAEVDDDDVDAIVQVGTNLSMVALCNEMAEELGKPMVPINAATYWHALRANGIMDQFSGHGPLFEHH